MVKKILYFIRSLAHKRVFESYRERNDMVQMVLGPKPLVIDGVMDDYRNFGIKNIKIYNSDREAKLITNSFKPDIFVQEDFPRLNFALSGCREVYVAHGMAGNHVLSLCRRDAKGPWNGFDLYCGATKRLKGVVDYITGKKNEVLVNALGQFDLLSYPGYFRPSKNNILFENKKPSILFCGFCCKNTSDFKLHNEDYFKTVYELERLAKKNDWLVIIKPRQGTKQVVDFLKQSGGWTKQYVKTYQSIVKSKYLHFIDFRANPCKYFSADIIMCNGCSTLEIEACIINKPLVVVRTKSGPKYDPFNTVSSGAAIKVENINNIEKTVMDIISVGNTRTKEQNGLLKDLNILTDGLAYKRVQDRLKIL